MLPLSVLRVLNLKKASKCDIFQKSLIVAYVHIEYSTHQFSEESKGPCGTEKSVVLRGFKTEIFYTMCIYNIDLVSVLHPSLIPGSYVI